MFVTTSFSGDFAVAQYNADGGLDASFGDGGKTTTDFGGNSDAANAVAIQSDGRVIAAGVTSPSAGLAAFALARYTERPSDTTPPEITVPGAMSVPATSPAGARVTFDVSAVDAVDGAVPVTCNPSTGSVFAVGDTSVTCNASDAAGNATSAGFAIHVKGAAEQLVDLGGAVVGVGPGDSLADKVGEAAAALRAGDRMTASSILSAFISQVQAQAGKSIGHTAATALIADASRIQAVLVR